MRIAVASDHAGYELKMEVIKYLSERGVEYMDFGCGPGERVDYPDYGERAIKTVCSGEFERAILVCGSGLGMAIVADKFKGIRATACWDEYSAKVSRSHNNSNCLSIGGRILDADKARNIVRIWLETQFEGGRHQARIDKISAIEERNFK